MVHGYILIAKNDTLDSSFFSFVVLLTELKGYMTMIDTDSSNTSSPIYYRLSELATAPASPARVYVERNGYIRKINAKPAHKGIVPLGASTILKWTKLGKFPKPVKPFPGVTLWRDVDIQAWLVSLNKASNDENENGGV